MKAKNSDDQAQLIKSGLDDLLNAIKIFPAPELEKRSCLDSIASSLELLTVNIQGGLKIFQASPSYMTYCELCEMETLQMFQGFDTDDEGNKLECSHCLTCGTMNVVTVKDVEG